MTLTLATTPVPTSWLNVAVPPIRHAVESTTELASRADAVAQLLRNHLPSVVAVPEQCLRATRMASRRYVLHVDPDGQFSIAAVIWGPGRHTSIHDHFCWGAVAVLAGIEEEIWYGLGSRRDRHALVEQGRRTCCPGEVTVVVPPGDIHQRRNTGSSVAISLRVYGTDIRARGSSIRRTYPAPGVLTPLGCAQPVLR
jgi:predicted metal-dependent enzyme (double-stranded beta helix superfamily)